MQEMMVAGGSGAYYPWSGPGSKKLVQGTLELGYFGEVTGAELFEFNGFKEMVGITAGLYSSAQFQAWLKFAYRGKIVYTTKYRLLSNISWLDIYAAGAAYGMKGPGIAPVPTPGAVDQFNMLIRMDDNIEGKYWPLVLRLMNSSNTDNSAMSGNWPSDQSEWDLLWGGIFNKGWEKYDWATINTTVGGYNLTRERAESPNYTGVRGGGAPLAKTNGGSDTKYQYRPTLELVRDPNIVLDVYHPFLTPVVGAPVVLTKVENDFVPLKGVSSVVLTMPGFVPSLSIESVIPSVSWTVSSSIDLPLTTANEGMIKGVISPTLFNSNRPLNNFNGAAVGPSLSWSTEIEIALSVTTSNVDTVLKITPSYYANNVRSDVRMTLTNQES
jgi:hypothetical protein